MVDWGIIGIVWIEKLIGDPTSWRLGYCQGGIERDVRLR